MVKSAEIEIKTGNSDLECLARDGMGAMNDFGDAFFYGLQEAGYSYRYVNDAASGNYGCSLEVIWAIEQPFKDYFMDKFEKTINV